MSTNSSIEWTDATWNPVTGCSKTSPGCKNCYAARLALRLKAMGFRKYRNEFNVTLHPEELERPLRWKKPRRIFVNSMSDLFHEKVPLAFIQDVFAVMAEANQHEFQILTKRAARLADLSPRLVWRPNIWMGVSVENAGQKQRIEYLRSTGAYVKFLSFEPLLGPVGKIDLAGIDWVIVGGEFGSGARPMQEAWVKDIRNQCVEPKVPFFFKRWGGTQKACAGRVLEGRFWNQMPQTIPF